MYNGWANRETWAAHLWITNDQETLATVLDYAYGYETMAVGIQEWFANRQADLANAMAVARGLG